MEYEAVIGLEVHVQLKTKAKLFTSVPYAYGAEPNTLVNEVVLGLPGTLPVANKGAIIKAVQAGLIFGCEIANKSKFDRKNYFYPDASKNYQISQYDQPLCKGGFVEIELAGPARNIQGQHRKVQLNRIHVEEDVGKLTHFNDDSLVDFNRAGVPLIEIVSEPDLFSAEEVFAYLKSLIMHLQYADISDCDMEKGQMRCDANISVRPKGTTTLGTKVELKNLNSISGVCSGVNFEIKRQINAIAGGETICQETRRWDAENNISTSMRSKEDAHDYRYFPDPDLRPICLSDAFIENIKNDLPELPFHKQIRYQQTLNLPYTITSVICPNKQLSDFFEQTISIYNKNPLSAANWIANDLLRELGQKNISIQDVKITPNLLAELIKLIDDNVLSKQNAKDVFLKTLETGESPKKIVKDEGLEICLDLNELKTICQSVINQFPKAVEEFLSGKEKAINVLKGQVMKQLAGKIPATEVDNMLSSLLKIEK